MSTASRGALKVKSKSSTARVQRASSAAAVPEKAFKAGGLAARPAKPAARARIRKEGSAALSWDKKLLQSISGLKAHDLVTKGVPVATAKSVMGAFRILEETEIYKTLGISAKTMQRRAGRADKTLDANASDRALRLVSVTNQAIGVFGSLEAAERWLSEPAIGLDRRRPIELLQSSEGTDMVKTLLGRIDYGVYS